MPGLDSLERIPAWWKTSTILEKAVILAILMGVVFTIGIVSIQSREERFSSLYLIPESYTGYPAGNSISFTYGIRSSERARMDYRIAIFLGNKMVDTASLALDPGGVIERNETLDITGLALPGKVSVTATSPKNTYEVHFWLKETPPIAAFTASPLAGKEPLNVRFTDLSNNSPKSWKWNFGDGATSTLRNPNHTFAAGSYTVTLTVTNSGGSDESIGNGVIEVIPKTPPVADFTASPRRGGTPLIVNFTDESLNSPASHFWEFGDGTTGFTKNPVHFYSWPGNYTVNLTVTNSDGSDTLSRPAYITTILMISPIADFTSNITAGSEPLAVQFMDRSSFDPSRWHWSFGDGEVSNQRNPVHTYEEDGTFTVKLTVSNDEGTDTEIREQYIAVYRVN